jgi:hypothetical protein
MFVCSLPGRFEKRCMTNAEKIAVMGGKLLHSQKNLCIIGSMRAYDKSIEILLMNKDGITIPTSEEMQ